MKNQEIFPEEFCNVDAKTWCFCSLWNCGEMRARNKRISFQQYHFNKENLLLNETLENENFTLFKESDEKYDKIYGTLH